MHTRSLIVSVAAGLLVAGAVFAQTSGEATPRPRQIVVPANVEWTNTMLTVRRGQVLRFDASGEIRLSFDGEDVAHASGAASGRSSGSAPIPTVPAGALIGRIGKGRPFQIGSQTNGLNMPDSGRLFLGINDDHVDDNSGNSVVKITTP